MDAKAYIRQQEQRDLETLNLPQDHDEEAKKPTRKTIDSALVKDDSSSGEEDEGAAGGETSSSDDGDEENEIAFPREDAADLLQFIHREVNTLQNMEDGQKRKFALIRLYQIFVQAKKKAPNKIY